MCILLGISSCIRLPVAQHPKRTIFTLPNSDVYDSPGSVMVAFDQAVVPGMDNRTVELIKWLGMHVSYVTRGPGPPSRAPKRDSDVLERKKITPKNPGSFQVKVKSYARNGQIVNKRGQKWSAWSVTGIMKKCHLCWGKIQLDTTIYGRIKGISPTKVHDVWVGNIMTPGVKSFRAVHHFHMFSDFLCSCYLCQLFSVRFGDNCLPSDDGTYNYTKMASEMKTTSLEGASGMEIAGGSHMAMLFFSAVQRILFGLKKRVALLGNSYQIPPKKRNFEFDVQKKIPSSHFCW